MKLFENSWLNSGMVAGLLLSGVNAQADSINLQFQFNGNSSGHDIYACNAGINTTNNTGSAYFHSITGASMTLAQCNATPHNCVTVDRTDQYKKNFLRASYGTWKSGSAPTTVGVTSANNSTAGTSGVLFNITGNTAWGSNISELTFNLGSPTMDAQYFVDICYRGSQNEFHETYGNSMELRWELTNSVTTANLSGRTSYTTDASVQVTSYVACDLQGEGTHTNGRDSGNNYNTLLRDHSETSISSGFTADLVLNTSAFAAPGTGSQTLFSAEPIDTTGGDVRAPRFCKIRYYFTETTGLRNQTATGSLFTLSTTLNSVANP